MMDYFDTGFALLMILFPAVFTLFIRQKDTRPERGNTKLVALRRRLWIWTAVAAFAHLILVSAGVPIATYLTPLMFFALWFLLALPVVRAKDPGWRGVPRTPLRFASLTRRDLLPPWLQHAWMALAVIWVLLLFVGVLGVLVDARGADMWWLFSFPVIGGAQLALFYWAGKRSLQEAEPSIQNETAEIRSARDGLRNLKQCGWLAVAAICVFIFSVPALVLIWFGESALMPAIVIGAGGGGLAGIGGGVFGTIADLRRAKLNRLCLDESPDVPAR
jgi:hypothetical protein